MFNLVITGLTLQPTRSRKVRGELDRIDIERLNNMHREVAGPPFDLRSLKDDAHQESLHSPFSTKKLPRPFSKIIQAQQEKCKRDRYLRDRLLREKASEHQRHDRLDESSGLTMQPGSAEARVLKGQRNRRTVSSAFFNLMRPLSSAFSSTDNA
ncbi:MAG TPA: hypothetical protein VGO47_04735, partial [Chlamydiales bacterium]|nr:hypothetical protein [Chlamydiales bacterium]